jgi:orotidine-5'-phosphate decarboxylase
MNRTELIHQIKTKKNYLCIGLDTDVKKIPAHIQSQPDAVLQFNKAIIDATKEYCIGYKINTAFYEVLGAKGWQILEETVSYIPSTHFKIADAKRGDIGNTSAQYARTFFETYAFDAVTVAPYMGEDSIRPFLEYENKFTIVLGLTSNKGANDFELLKTSDNYFFYEKIISTIANWGTRENLMFVVGATQTHQLKNIRNIIPQHFLLIPGVGAQGGSLKEVSEYGMNKDCGLIVNASRAIIYKSSKKNFAEEAANAAKEYAEEMKMYISTE